MAVPTHGPLCQTLVYDTSCWYCQQEIFVLQCTCGSAVLFDDARPPWPKHIYPGTGDAGGIDGSGLSGWAAVDVLREQGVPVTPDIIQRIFPNKQQINRKTSLETGIRRIKPENREQRPLLAVVRELHRSTHRTEATDALSEIGLELIGLTPEIRYHQITLMNKQYARTRVSPHLFQIIRCKDCILT